MTRLQIVVKDLSASQHNTPQNLEEAGWTKREIESAVQRGELRWLADGRIEVVDVKTP